MFSHSYSTVLLQKYPTLHCQQYWLFFQNRFHWLAECWFYLNISTDLSLSVPPSLSLSCASLCVTTQFTYEAVICRVCLSTSTVGGYALHLPSISHVDGIQWIPDCLVHIQSFSLVRMIAKKMPLFPLLLLYVVVTQQSVPQIVYYGIFGILCSSLVIVCFLWLWYIVGLK